MNRRAETIETEINLPVSAFLPEDFISDADQRLIAYKRLATLADEQSIEDLAGEWRDRYGAIAGNGEKPRFDGNDSAPSQKAQSGSARWRR